MTCEEFWIHYSQTDRAEGEHLAQCPECAAKMAGARSVANGLRLLASDMSAIEAPPQIEANLVAAFRRRNGSPKLRRAAWWKSPVFVGATAGFAVTALAFGLFIMPKRRVADPPAAHHTRSQQIQLASYAPQESDDGFIPLPDVPQIDPNDEVNVVRVELPRSAMLEVGLDVPPDQVAGTVEAEVKLGPDGLARAVRFME